MGKPLLLLLMLVSSLHAAGCIAIEGDQIRGRDLAQAEAAFAQLNPDLYVSYAPAVGNQRSIAPQELSAIAAANGISYTPHGALCFTRSSFTLTAAEAAVRIRDAFGPRTKGVQVEVLEVCRCSLPAGTLQFSLHGAALPPLGHSDTPTLWRGQLISKSGMSYPIWVRARVLAKLTLVRAKENIRAQAIVEPSQLEEVTATESPLRFAGTQALTAYVGKLATRSILEGSYLDPQFVRTPPDITRGTIVKVDVIDGLTHLQLDARAETGGSTGDRITLINPSGMHHFQATVSGPGRAQILLSPSTETETSAENKDALVATTSRRIL